MNLTFRGSKIFVTLSLALALSITAGWGENKPQVGLLFVGSFEKADITSEVAGARKTKLSAAYTWSYGVRLFTDKVWKESGLDWDEFSARAAALADQLASNIEPEYVRNRRGVIDYATVTSSNPFLSSAITSPNFLKPFANTLGEKLHVIVIDQNILYVFPRTGSRLSEFSPSLIQIFRETPYPVSLEVFEVDRSGFRVIGEIDRADQDVEID